MSSSSSYIDKYSKHSILFGDSFKFDHMLIDNMLQNHYFEDIQYKMPSVELAKLAELFSSLGSEFKYTNGYFHKSDIYVKPNALKSWLLVAKSRKFTYMRLALHGSDTKTYESVENDPVGMDLKCAGKNGEREGRGYYFALSDHASQHYNREWSNNSMDGTALLAVILTEEKIEETDGRYKVFNLYGPSDHVRNNNNEKERYNNCIAMYDGKYILILGKVVSL